MQSYIKKANLLDLTSIERHNPVSSSEEDQWLPMKVKGTRLKESQKWVIIATICDFGASEMSPREREKLIEAVIRTQSYYLWYNQPAISTEYVRKLFHRFKHSMLIAPASTYNIYSSRAGQGRRTYVDQLQDQYPKLLHKIYRYSTSVLGADASAKAIVELMNQKSKALHPNCEIWSNLRLNTYHFWLFFHNNNGSLRKNTSKPRLTEEQRKKRIVWAKEMLRKLEIHGDDFHVCFIDEKQFYSSSRRKKKKTLPRATFETHREAHAKTPGIL